MMRNAAFHSAVEYKHPFAYCHVAVETHLAHALPQEQGARFKQSIYEYKDFAAQEALSLQRKRRALLSPPSNNFCKSKRSFYKQRIGYRKKNEVVSLEAATRDKQKGMKLKKRR
jgi:hypothetical protein